MPDRDLPAASLSATPPLRTENYVPLLPLGANDESLPQFLPVASNHTLNENFDGITRAIIVVHDQMRDASGALGLITTLAGTSNRTTLILAPQFLLEVDILRYASDLPERGIHLTRWPLSGTTSSWEDGGDSVVRPAQKGVSSFIAIDMLLLYLADLQRFPHLQQIVVTGYGAGGDFVQRYATIGQAAEILDTRHRAVRYVIVNANSYLYFTPERPRQGHAGFAPPVPTICPDYDTYKYGLQNLNDYASHVGANAIKLRYVARNILYFVGAKAAAEDTIPDSSCAALLEGGDRLARAKNYAQYLSSLYNNGPEKLQNFILVPKAGLDAAQIFSSRCGVSALFGDGICR